MLAGIAQPCRVRFASQVKGWYTALAAEMAGLYFKDGGPITMVQVDNETSDWCAPVADIGFFLLRRLSHMGHLGAAHKETSDASSHASGCFPTLSLSRFFPTTQTE